MSKHEQWQSITMTKKKTDLTPDESALFQQNIKGSKRIKQDKLLIEKKIKSKSVKHVEPPDFGHADNFKYSSNTYLDYLAPDDWLSAEDYIHFARDGIQHRTLSKLKKGQMPIEARLDLHRLTGDEAVAESTHFIEQCLEQQLRTVLIVHGKGQFSAGKGPVLKNLLNIWLREQAHVLAFSSSRPKDGGTGAVYVLLKSRNKLHEK